MRVKYWLQQHLCLRVYKVYILRRPSWNPVVRLIENQSMNVESTYG